MQKSGVVGYIYLICQWSMRFAYLNLLWLVFSILGAVVFGVIPATVSLFSVQRKWVMGYEDVPVFSTFLQQYKENFIKANILGILLTFIGWLIYFDLKFFVSNGAMFYQIISLLIYILSIWYIIVLLFIFPVYVHFELKLIQNIKYAYIVSILNPLNTLLTVVCSGGTLFLVLYFPKLIFIFGLSLPCFIIMFFANQIFERIEQMKRMKGVKI